MTELHWLPELAWRERLCAMPAVRPHCPRDAPISPTSHFILGAICALTAYIALVSVDKFLGENIHFVLVLPPVLDLRGDPAPHRVAAASHLPIGTHVPKGDLA